MTIQNEDGARWYEHTDDARIPEGEKFPSATTVLGVIPKPWLLPWVKREAIFYLERAITAGRLPHDDEGLLAEFREALGAAERKGEAAADAGSILHNVFQMILGGAVEAIPPEQITPEIGRASINLARVVAGAGLVQVEGEKIIVSNRHRYAGRLDTLATVKGKRGLGVIDLKTGSRVRKEHSAQVAAYYYAERETGRGDEVRWAGILHCPLDGKTSPAIHYIDNLKGNYRDFIAARLMFETF